MKKLGKLNEIGDIRQIWPNEATDFTPWLSKEENIAIKKCLAEIPKKTA